MDPSRNLCLIKDSFTNHDTKYVKKVYKEVEVGSPRTRRNKLTETVYPKFKLDSLKKGKIFQTDSIFKTNGIILANIDAVYNFSGQEDGYLKPQIIKKFDYTCLDADEDYIRYLQYRLPISVGFTPCHKYKNIDDRLLNCNKDLVNYVLSIKPEGTDLVISKHFSDIKKALKLCKPGGTWICKIEEIDVSNFYIAASSFEEFSFFQPLSEQFPNSYIICEKYKGNYWIDLVDKPISVPSSFLNFLKEFEESLSSFEPLNYNNYKCLAIWNIY